MIAVLAALAACHPSADDTDAAPITAYDPLPLVDVFVATGGDGFGVGSATPAATVPFGMVKVGPDTRGSLGDIEYAHCDGYRYDDDHITAVSHAHAHGIGIADYGMIGFLPRDGWDARWTRDATRAAPFDHATEVGSPGYYAVTLGDDQIRLELTATPHGAMHRYTYATGADPVVVVDLGHTYGGTTVASASVDFDGTTLRGYENLVGGYSGRFGGLKVYFSSQFDPAPIAEGTWTDPDAPQPDTTTASGTIAGMWLQFPPGTTTVTARVALSYVDADGADANLAAELPVGTDFEATRSAAEAAWRSELGVVRVRGGTEEERKIFHTAMYHAYQMPTLFSDTDGRYRGIDGQVHTTDTQYYSDFSLWDTFRTLHPWLILVRPDRQRDMAASLVHMDEDWGAFDRWPMGHGATGGMVGSPTDQVLAETWLKGIQDGWDVNAAFDASYAHATGPVSPEGRDGIAGYASRGYVAWEDSGTPAALTLEYSWNDAGLANWAHGLGRTDEAAVLDRQSQSWKNTWDPSQQFFVGRHADGTFDPPVTPEAFGPDFVEGNAWQYAWEAPYDVDGMIEVQAGGDREAWLDRLDQFWADSEAAVDNGLPDTHYWHGNEPDIHDSALAALAGAPDRSAPAIRWIAAKKYADSPAGLDGNDDGGTLSAWYLWNAIGLFPVAGTDRYAVVSPWFERAEIDRSDGSTLVIEAPGASDIDLYVQSAELGGDVLQSSVVTHGDLISGGELRLTMGASPAGWPDTPSTAP